MLARPARLVLATFVLALPRVLPAQLTSSLEVGTQSARSGSGEWKGLATIAPALHYDHPFATVSAFGTFAGAEGGRTITDGTLSATAFTPSFLGLRASIAGIADRSTFANGLLISSLSAEARLSWRAGGGGAWLGRDVSRDDHATLLPATPRITLGGWRQVGSAIITVAIGSSSASVGGTTSGFQHKFVRDSVFNDTTQQYNYWDRPDSVLVNGRTSSVHAWTDAETGVHWSRGRLALDALLGMRVRTRQEEPATWGRLDATIALTPRMAVVAGGGVRAEHIAYGVPGSRYLALGLRLAPDALARRRPSAAVRPVAAGFSLAPVGRGMYSLSVRVPRARVVELSGDFTRWQPIALTRGRGDSWQVTLPLAPGAYRLNIRVDGDAWVAPPGTSTVQDEFNGTVGLVVVP